MMRLVREHVSEHGPSGGPRWRPTVARELCNAAMRSGRESIRQHAQALRGASPVRGGSLLPGAAVGIERRRTLQMRRGTPQPLQTGVVQLREDGGDGPALAFLPGLLVAPGPMAQPRPDDLVHSVLAGVAFYQAVTIARHHAVGLERH